MLRKMARQFTQMIGEDYALNRRPAKKSLAGFAQTKPEEKKAIASDNTGANLALRLLSGKRVFYIPQ